MGPEQQPGAGDNRGFSLFVALGEGTHRVCANAIDDANQLNPELGCQSVNVPSGATIGNFENAGAATDGIAVSGWALDRSRTASIDVHAYVDGAFGAIAKADVTRTDVGSAFPGYGSAHGFAFIVPAAPGSHEVCVFGIDDGGPNPKLGCKRVTVAGGSQGTKGNLEGVRRPNGGDPLTLEVRGWALDPDTSASTQVHIYVGGPYPEGKFGGSGVADRARPDVAAAVPGVGDKHGFTFTIPYAPGHPRVCAHAIDTNGGGNTMIGCATPPNVGPIGNFEGAVRSSGTELRLTGWLLDPDATGPVTLHVYVGAPYGQGGTFGGAFTANAARSDVGQAFPGYGDGHGFDVRVTVPSGSTPVYVYAIDDAGVLNTLVGSKSA